MAGSSGPGLEAGPVLLLRQQSASPLGGLGVRVPQGHSDRLVEVRRQPPVGRGQVVAGYTPRWRGRGVGDLPERSETQ